MGPSGDDDDDDAVRNYCWYNAFRITEAIDKDDVEALKCLEDELGGSSSVVVAHTVVELYRHNDADADADADADSTKSALHRAIEESRNRVALHMLQHPSFNVNGRVDSVYTPLLLASRYGNLGVLSYLLERSDLHVNAHGGERNTEEWGSTALHLACCSDNLQVLQCLLACPEINVNAQDSCGDTPLHLAGRHEHGNAVECLLQHPHTQLHIMNRRGITVLDIWAEREEWGLVSRLLNHANCLHSVDRDAPILKLIVWDPPLEIIVQAARHVATNINKRNPQGQTLLHLIQWFGTSLWGRYHPRPRSISGRLRNSSHVVQCVSKFVRCLLEIPTLDINVQDGGGNTVLCLCCAHGDVLQLSPTLLEYPHTNIFISNSIGMTPFHVAVRNGSFQLVECIVRRYPQAVNHANPQNGTTPLHLAVTRLFAGNKGGRYFSNHQKVLCHLLKLETTNLNLQDHCGNTALHIVAMMMREKRETAVDSLINHPKIQLLMRNHEGRTPAQEAELEGSTNKSAAILASILFWKEMLQSIQTVLLSTREEPAVIARRGTSTFDRDTVVVEDLLLAHGNHRVTYKMLHVLAQWLETDKTTDLLQRERNHKTRQEQGLDVTEDGMRKRTRR